MAEVILKHLAEDDLSDIWLYIAVEKDAKRTDDYLIKIYALLEKIGQFPKIGQTRNDLGKALQSFPVESHIVYYEDLDNIIYIERVLHMARDKTTIPH